MTTLIRALFALLGPKRTAIAIGALTGALLVLTGATEAIRAVLNALGIPTP